MSTQANSIPEAIKPIWKATLFVQTCNGLAFGLYLFTFGPWFYDAFGGDKNAATAMMMTSILLGVRQGGVAVLEAPTGAIADAIGRVHAIGWSWFFRVFFFVGLAALPLCNNLSATFTCSVVASLAFSLSYTFFNGAFSAWVVDSCRHADPNFQYGLLLTKGHAANLWGQFIGGFVGVCFFLQGLAQVSYLLGGALSFVLMSYCLREMPETPHLNFLGVRDTLVNIMRRVGEILGAGAVIARKIPSLLVLIFVYGSMMFLVNVVDYFWPLAIRSQLGISDRQYLWLGFLSILCLTRIFGARVMRFLLARIKAAAPHRQLISLRRWLLSLCLVSAVAVLMLGTADSTAQGFFWWLMAAVLLVSLCNGFLVPCYETLMHHYIPAEYAQMRSTLLSFGSLIRSTLILLLSVPAGGHSSTTTTHGWIVPALLVLLSAVVARFVLKPIERRALSQTNGG